MDCFKILIKFFEVSKKLASGIQTPFGKDVVPVVNRNS